MRLFRWIRALFSSGWFHPVPSPRRSRRRPRPCGCRFDVLEERVALGDTIGIGAAAGLGLASLAPLVQARALDTEYVPVAVASDARSSAGASVQADFLPDRDVLPRRFSERSAPTPEAAPAPDSAASARQDPPDTPSDALPDGAWTAFDVPVLAEPFPADAWWHGSHHGAEALEAGGGTGTGSGGAGGAAPGASSAAPPTVAEAVGGRFDAAAPGSADGEELARLAGEQGAPAAPGAQSAAHITVQATTPPATPPHHAAGHGGHAPVVGVDPPVWSPEGQSFGGIVADFPTLPPQPGMTTTINWGDGSSSGGSVMGDGSGGVQVSGGHTYAEEGQYSVQTVVRDAQGNIVGTDTSPAKVPDAALRAGQGLIIRAGAGVAFTGDVATFADQNPSGTVVDFTATIHWGDGRSSAGTVRPSTGGFTVSGSHTYATNGTFTTRVNVTDDGGSTTPVEGTAYVGFQAEGVNVSTTEGLGQGVAVATLQLPPGGASSSYSATITWGDGSASTAGSIVSGQNGAYLVVGSHGYLEEGTFDVSVAISGPGGASATTSSTAFVTDAPLTAQGAPVSAIAGRPFTAAVAGFRDQDPKGTAADYTAFVDWGDGSKKSQGSISGGFTVSGTHVYAQPGTYTATVTIVDAGGSSTTAPATITVAAGRLIGQGAPTTWTEGLRATTTVAAFSDTDGTTDPGAYTASISWGDGTSSAGVLGAGFVVSGTHTYAEHGTYSVTVLISDSDGDQLQVAGPAQVADAHLTVQGRSFPETAGKFFKAIVGTFSDGDPGGQTSDYNATITWGDGSETGGSITPDPSGGFDIWGGHTYDNPGTYDPGITVTEGDGSAGDGGAGGSGTDTISAGSASDQLTANGINATEGLLFSGTVGTYTPGDPNASPPTITIGWGDGLVTNAALVPNGQGGYLVQGSHLYTEETSISLTLTLTIAGTGQSADSSVSVGDAALSGQGIGISAWAGVPTGDVIVGTFSDANPYGSVADFTATVNWGDNSTQTVEVVPAGGSSYDVVGNHTYAQAGDYSITVVVLDDGGATVTLNGQAQVADPAGGGGGGGGSAGGVATEGLQFSGTVATVQNPAAPPVSASIDWGDGTTSQGTISDNGNNTYRVSGQHTYAEEGTYTVLVTPHLANGNSFTLKGPFQVVDAQLHAVGRDIVATAGKPTGLVTVAAFTDDNPQATLADFMATIDWGDNISSAAAVLPDGQGGFYVTGNHTYALPRAYTVTTTIIDDGGSTAQVTSTARVGSGNSVSSAGKVAEGQPFPVDVILPVPPSPEPVAPDQYTATITWGDGTSSQADVTPLIKTDGSGIANLVVTGVHVYPDEGNYTATVTAQEPGGNSTMTTLNVPVGDAELAGEGHDVQAVPNRSTGRVKVAEFVDENPDAKASDFTVEIDWGDGSQVQTTAVVDPEGGFDVLGDHTYTADGDYKMTVTVTDDGGEEVIFKPVAHVVDPWTITGAVQGNRSNDPARAFLLPLGEASVDLNQGALRLSHALDFDQSPGTAVGGDPALVYNSATVNVKPVVQFQIQTDPDPVAPKATDVKVTLTWAGVDQTPVHFDPSDWEPGGLYLLAAQTDNAVTTTGAYAWKVKVHVTFANGSTRDSTASGASYVVAADGSLYGAGWGIDGISRLVATAAGVLWVTGAGDWRFFTANPDGSFQSPAEDFGTLVQNPDQSYTYTAKDQTKYQFDGNGFLRSVVDPHGLTRTYTYNGSGTLQSVTAPDGGVTVFNYDLITGYLTGITEPGGRLVRLGHDGNGNLNSLVDVDGSGRAFEYDGNHHLTEDLWNPLDAHFSYNATTGLLEIVDRGLGSLYTITSAAEAGLLGAANGPALASVTDGLSHTTNYLLDERGRLLADIQPDGATTLTLRDAAGQVNLAVDPTGIPTVYSYAYAPVFDAGGNFVGSDGDLLAVTQGGGGTTQYAYDSTYHHVTVQTDPMGRTTVNSYNATGDLATSTDPMGYTTADVWANGLLMSETDPMGRITEYRYDGARRLAATIDPTGAWSFHTYDVNGNPLQSIDPLGRVTTTLYDGRNEEVSTIDANGGVSTTLYNAYGQVTADVNARGFATFTQYDQRGFATEVTDGTGATTQTGYDAAGNVIETLDARGNPTFYGHDLDNRQTSVTDAAGFTSYTAYDPGGDVLATQDTMGGITSYGYNLLHERVVSTDPMGRTSYTFYNLDGEVIGKIDPRGLPSLNLYDADGRVTATVDARGGVSRTFYDRDGEVIETIDPMRRASFPLYDPDGRKVLDTDPLGRTTESVYDPAGELIESIDPRGAITHYGYDALGRRVAELDPDGNLSLTIPDAVGNPVLHIDPNLGITVQFFDGDNRPVLKVDPLGYISFTIYDLVGNPVLSVDANGEPTQTFYNALDEPFLTIDPDWHLNLTDYDGAGETVITIDGMGDTTFYGYNWDGERVVEMDPRGALTLVDYNADGQPQIVIDSDWNPTVTLYDAGGNPAVTVDALGNVSFSWYDLDNELAVSRDRDARWKTFAYDDAGQLRGETWFAANGQVTDTLNFAYDLSGNLIAASNHYGTYLFSYDAAGRKRTQTDPFGLGLAYAYDGLGNVTAVADSLGGVVASGYDLDGRLRRRGYSGPGGVQLRFDQIYTPDGQVLAQARSADLGGTQTVSTSQFAYDPNGNLLHLQHRDGAGNVLGDYQYLYDLADRLAAESDNGQPIGYRYDPSGQLTQAGGALYAYDPNGNRVMGGSIPGIDNRLIFDGTWLYSYDAEGNVLQKLRWSDGRTWTYTWDNANHMTSATETQWNGTLVVRETMQYDVFGNLVEKDTLTAATTAVQGFAYDGANVWADLDGNGSLTTRRVYGDNPDQPIARVAAGAVSWYLPDRLGSVRLVVGASGAVQDQASYDAFGNLTAEANPLAGDRFKYAGYGYDVWTGLYNAGARWYDPSAGRWTSEDPLGFAAGDSNLNRYVGNGPTNATDPTGLAPEWWKKVREEIRQGSNDYVNGIDVIVNGSRRLLMSVDESTKDVPGPVRNLGPQYGFFKGLEIFRAFEAYQDRGLPWYAGAAAAYTSNMPFFREGFIAGEVMEGRSLRGDVTLGRPLTVFDYVRRSLETGEDGLLLLTLRSASPGADAASIATPKGPALQSASEAAMAARAQVLSGAKLYRIGTMGRSGAAEAQYWALEPPTTPGFAQRYGIPPENVTNADFIAVGTLKPGTRFITREAPSVGTNKGGGIEVVVPENGVQVQAVSAGKGN
jgi:RHS repeat-associated protein